MKSIRCGWVLCIFVLALDAHAETREEAAIRAHMALLADDALEGRLTGSRGYELAAKYVAAQFAGVGLEPFAGNGTWFQSVPLVEGQRVPLAATLTFDGAAGRFEAKPGEDFVANPSYHSTDASVSADAVFVGYAVSAPELGYDDFANGPSLQGKIAIVLSGAPPTFTSSHRAYHSSGIVKAALLAERGAAGVLSVRTPLDEKRTPWERVLQQSWVTGMRWLDAQGQPVNSDTRIGAAINRTAAEQLFKSGGKDLAAAFAATEASKPQAFDLPVRVSLTTKTALRQLSSSNVVGVLRGSDPKLRDEYIVFTAHLDHIGRGATVGTDSVYNGALDNASGVAILIEAARMLANSPRRPKRSIIFAAVTGEEKGLLGAEYFVEHPPVPVTQLVANINMDMPVALTDLAEFVAYGAEHSSLGADAARAVRAEGRKLVPDPNPEEVIFVRSDQYSFVRAGIPALYIDNAFKSVDPAVDGAALVRDFLRTRYHQPSDDLSQPIHYATLARLARINVRIARAVGNARERPTWNRGDFFGRTFGPERMAQ
jgi:Zn-dependent M28 family amino/carboxypeptidase